MNKLASLFDVFRKGSAVADPELWKNRTALVVALSALFMAIAQVAKAYGYDLGVDQDTATALGGGVAAVVGLWGTFATSDKVGLPPRRESDDSGQTDLRGGP